ncbi:MAG: hypothetical protein ACI4XI_01720 [Ruminococcus sp.]
MRAKIMSPILDFVIIWYCKRKEESVCVTFSETETAIAALGLFFLSSSSAAAATMVVTTTTAAVAVADN